MLKTFERRLVAAAVSSALAVPMMGYAQVTTDEESAEAESMSAAMEPAEPNFAVSGFINRAVVIVDKDGDAKDGDLQHTDGKQSPTRFRFTGSRDLNAEMSVGVNLELGGPATWATRHAAVDLSGAFGKLTVGHTTTAADGMPFADGAFNGGSWLAGVTNSCAWVANGPACMSNNSSRRDILRFDTPKLGPATISVATGNDDYWDTKLAVAGAAGAARYDFRIGYIGEYDKSVDAVPSKVEGHTVESLRKKFDLDEVPDSLNVDEAARRVELQAEAHEDFPVGANLWRSSTLDKDAAGDPLVRYQLSLPETPATTEKDGDILTVSAAFNFGQGTTIGAAWSRNDLPNEPTQEHEYTYLSVDQSYGAGSIGIHWKKGEITDSAEGEKDVEGTNWGIGWGHTVGSGVEAYAGWRRVEEDGEADANLYLTGMRVTFN